MNKPILEWFPSAAALSSPHSCVQASIFKAILAEFLWHCDVC
uniref:Uncharacterized protein n=1 Tax=Anguilla anguilla TaxID=7936 RepID=A0A0E9RW21_ANGAN